MITAASEATYSGCAPLRSVWHLLRKPFELSMLEEQMLLCCAESISDQRLRRSAGR